MKAEEKLFTELREKELTRHQLFELGLALRELAEAMTERSAWDTLRHVGQAERYITEFRGSVVPMPKLTNREAELSAGLHTYMRKCMDCHLGTMLYRMIAENRGSAVWFSFIKGLVANKCNYREGMEAAGLAYEASQTTDNLLMLKALWMWEEGEVKDAIAWLKGDDHEGNAGTC